MAKIKTRDLILDVALILFNERGESVVTSVDLANEMNISPGNLYYHFKGKEEVVEELYAQFHARVLLTLKEITSQPNESSHEILAGLVVLAQVLQQFKFISQDVHGIHERYTELRQPFKVLFSLIEQSLNVLVSKIIKKSKIVELDNAVSLLSDNLLFTLLNYGSYDDLLDRHDRAQEKSIEEHLYLHILPFI